MTGKEDDFKPTASYEAGLKGDASRFENHTGTLVNAVQGHYMRNLSGVPAEEYDAIEQGLQTRGVAYRAMDWILNEIRVMRIYQISEGEAEKLATEDGQPMLPGRHGDICWPLSWDSGDTYWNHIFENEITELQDN
jgi:hypothetical protein